MVTRSKNERRGGKGGTESLQELTAGTEKLQHLAGIIPRLYSTTLFPLLPEIQGTTAGCCSNREQYTQIPTSDTVAVSHRGLGFPVVAMTVMMVVVDMEIVTTVTTTPGPATVTHTPGPLLPRAPLFPGSISGVCISCSGTFCISRTGDRSGWSLGCA